MHLVGLLIKNLRIIIFCSRIRDDIVERNVLECERNSSGSLQLVHARKYTTCVCREKVHSKILTGKNIFIHSFIFTLMV